MKEEGYILRGKAIDIIDCGEIVRRAIGIGVADRVGVLAEILTHFVERDLEQMSVGVTFGAYGELTAKQERSLGHRIRLA